jgi:hypothetical protein
MQTVFLVLKDILIAPAANYPIMPNQICEARHDSMEQLAGSYRISICKQVNRPAGRYTANQIANINSEQKW